MNENTSTMAATATTSENTNPSWHDIGLPGPRLTGTFASDHRPERGGSVGISQWELSRSSVIAAVGMGDGRSVASDVGRMS